MLNEVSVEITRTCANNCIHCSSMSNDRCLETLSFTKFKEIVTDAKALGARTICFSGGEPFLHNNIVEMIKYVSSLNMQSYVYTGGIVFDDEKRRSSINKKILLSIADYVTKIIFNIEAAKEETYDCIMGTKGCFPLLLKSIEETVGCSIVAEAHFVPMRINIDEINDVVRLCTNYSISKLSFLRLVLHGRAKINRKQIELSMENYDSVRNTLKLLREQAKIDIRIGLPLDFKSSCVQCEAACGKLNISYDGTVFPCEVFKNDEPGIVQNGRSPANIHEKSLREIYENSEYLNFVRIASKAFENSDLLETCLGQHLINMKRGNGFDE